MSMSIPVILNGAPGPTGTNDNTCRLGTTAGGGFCSDVGSILGGRNSSGTMTLRSAASTIVMGDLNRIMPITPTPLASDGSFNTILNGNSNRLCGNYNSIFGGQLNRIIWTLLPGVEHSAIMGGRNNTICSQASVIMGGDGHAVQAAAHGSFIGGGDTNIVAGSFGAISGGILNTISGNFGTVGGGSTHRVLGNNSVVIGGDTNHIQNAAESSIIGGGFSNTIDIFGNFNTIFGGFSNTIDAGVNAATIAGGERNEIFAGGDFSSIGGGSQSRILSRSGSIVGGVNNKIFANADNSIIGGGDFNEICANSLTGSIGGGLQNIIGDSTVGDSLNTIVGGSSNCAFGRGGFVGGGSRQGIAVDVINSVIGGGDANIIAEFSDFSFIGGGRSNCISVLTGSLPNQYNVILGGETNCIAQNRNGAVIGGGQGNIVRDNCSAILGGLSNDTNGFSYVGMFGQALSGTVNNSFVVEHLVATNLPTVAAYASLPFKALYTCPVGTSPVCHQVLIK